MAEFIEIHPIYDDNDVIDTMLIRKDVIKAVYKCDGLCLVYAKRAGRRRLFGRNYVCLKVLDDYDYLREQLTGVK